MLKRIVRCEWRPHGLGGMHACVPPIAFVVQMKCAGSDADTSSTRVDMDMTRKDSGAPQFMALNHQSEVSDNPIEPLLADSAGIAKTADGFSPDLPPALSTAPTPETVPRSLRPTLRRALPSQIPHMLAVLQRHRMPDAFLMAMR